jgi:hypothetical protein
VERFIHYLRHSLYVPLAAKLKQAGLDVDVESANLAVWRWLRDVANTRVHRTTEAIPAERWVVERSMLLPVLVPPASTTAAAPPAAGRPLPRPVNAVRLQHPLSVYDEVLAMEVKP